MKLIIRGHVRQAFESPSLCRLVKNLNVDEIYIQTWNKKQSSLSWRPMREIREPVDEIMVQNYFNELGVKKIIVLDEAEVQLSGRTEGRLCRTLMPIKGWKYMLHGMKCIVDYVASISNPDDLVLMTRFDILNFKDAHFIERFARNPCPDLIFANETSMDVSYGADNLILAKCATLVSLLTKMVDLDSVSERFPEEVHQEALFSKVYNSD